MYNLICSQVAHLERSGHYLTVKDNQVSELVVELEDHTIRLWITKCPLSPRSLTCLNLYIRMLTIVLMYIGTLIADDKYSHQGHQ